MYYFVSRITSIKLRFKRFAREPVEEGSLGLQICMHFQGRQEDPVRKDPLCRSSSSSHHSQLCPELYYQLGAEGRVHFTQRCVRRTLQATEGGRELLGKSTAHSPEWMQPGCSRQVPKMDPAPSPQSQPSDCWVGVLTLLPMPSRSPGPCLDPHPISCQLPSLPPNPGNALSLTGTGDSEYAPMSHGGRLLRPQSRPCEHRGEGQSQKSRTHLLMPKVCVRSCSGHTARTWQLPFLSPLHPRGPVQPLWMSLYLPC